MCFKTLGDFDQFSQKIDNKGFCYTNINICKEKLNERGKIKGSIQENSNLLMFVREIKKLSMQ